MTPATELDKAIISSTYYCISNALTQMQTMTRAFKSLRLDTEFTSEEKKKIKHDLEFTSRAIQYLGRAQRAYQECIKALDLINAEFDERVNPESYDLHLATANEILAITYLYMHKADNDPQTEAQIHKFLLDVGKPTGEEFQQIYTALMNKARRMEGQS